MKPKHRFRSPLAKKARRGFRGYPVATLAFYGPDNTRASKVAVGIMTSDTGGPKALERWFSDAEDVRNDETIGRAVLEFIKRHEVKSVVMTDGIIGCPHEEEIDYPKGQSCPHCPYWAGRDRWTGERIH